MFNVMLDLETMGNRPNAAIVAIGACYFYPAAQDVAPIAQRFYRKVTLASSVSAGLEMDASTVEWWMQQSDAARQSTFGGDGRVPLGEALLAFNEFVGAHRERPVAVWGNGATFDNVIIRNAMNRKGIDPCWSFRNDKCYRTVVNLLTEDKRPASIRSGTSHNALDDAVTQAQHLALCYKALGLT